VASFDDVAKDRFIQNDVPDRLERALIDAGVDHDVKQYPGTRHGFMNEHDPGDLPVWIRLVARLTEAAYDDSSRAMPAAGSSISSVLTSRRNGNALGVFG
jgi:dienelactone hydrolase